MIAFLSSSEKKKLLNEMEERFGWKIKDCMFLQAGRERIRAFTGTLSREELNLLSEFARVEFAGAYFVRQEPFGLRLSFDMTQLFAEEFSQNVIDLTPEEFTQWMHGESLIKDVADGFYVVRHGSDFLGSTFVKKGKLYNYVPKERLLKR